MTVSSKNKITERDIRSAQIKNIRLSGEKQLNTWEVKAG